MKKALLIKNQWVSYDEEKRRKRKNGALKTKKEKEPLIEGFFFSKREKELGAQLREKGRTKHRKTRNAVQALRVLYVEISGG